MLDAMYFDDWQTNIRYKDAIISNWLLWDFDLNRMDWQGMRAIVVQRVVERGGESDFYAAIKKYGGLDKFRDIIKNEVAYLSNRDMDFVCLLFGLKKTDLRCYIRKQLREKHLNS